jgi:hypothetical protein
MAFEVIKISFFLDFQSILRCQSYFTSKCHSIATVHVSDHFREFYKSRSHGLKREKEVFILELGDASLLETSNYKLIKMSTHSCKGKHRFHPNHMKFRTVKTKGLNLSENSNVLIVKTRNLLFLIIP